MKIIYLHFLLFVCLLARDYPLYSQCDPKWANQKVGTSSKTICEVGSLVSSVASALTGTGHNQNPSTLNTWLNSNKGYDSKNDFVWGSLNQFGFAFQGKVANSMVRLNLDVGYIVIVNVRNGAHWVLATGFSGNTIFVKDSLYPFEFYDISEVVNGNSGVYKVATGILPIFINDIEQLISKKRKMLKAN